VTRQIRLASGASAPRRGSEYAELSRLVREAGLLERRPGYYAGTIAVTIGLLAAGWTAFVVLGNSWWQLAVAAFLAVVFTQIGFLGHDAGHRQVFRTRRASYVTGILLGNLGIGLSYCWWVDKHNRHHAHPNTEGADPDIAVGALAFSSAQARASRGLARLVFRYQAYLFFPLLLGEAVSLHVASVRALSRRAARRRCWERALITVHAAGYLTAVFLVLSPVKAVVFIIVQQGLFGLYLGCSFAPNHKGMPILAAGDRSDFLRRQALTSRNVRGGRLTDVALGGLNYQIEHHLFPSMPRPNLRRSQPLIEAFCRQRGVPYRQSSLAGSHAQALRYLNTAGKPAGPGTRRLGPRPSSRVLAGRLHLQATRWPRRPPRWHARRAPRPGRSASAAAPPPRRGRQQHVAAILAGRLLRLGQCAQGSAVDELQGRQVHDHAAARPATAARTAAVSAASAASSRPHRATTM
jgi:fatty acid desaturase